MRNSYSPRPIEDYFLPGRDKDEFRVIAESKFAIPAWNLYWLSTPAVDFVPAYKATNRLHCYYVVNVNAYAAIIRDAMHDEQMQHYLCQPPADFYQWFSAEPDYTIYDTWDHLGSQWVNTVLQRAEMAIRDRLRSRPLVRVEGGRMTVNLEHLR